MALRGYVATIQQPVAGTTGVIAAGLAIPCDTDQVRAFYFWSSGGEVSGTFASGSARRYHMHSFAVPPGTGSTYIGVGASAIDQYCFGSVSHGTADSFGEFYSETHCIVFMDHLGAFGTARLPVKATIDAITDNGDGTCDLDLDWDVNEAASNPRHLIHVLAIYDDADTAFDVALVKWAADGTADPITITGVGVQADVVWSIGNRTETGPESTSAGGKTLMFAMNCQGEQVACGSNLSNGSGQSVGVRVQESAKAAVGLLDETLQWTMTRESMDASGWTLIPDPVSAGSFAAFAVASLVFSGGVSSTIKAFEKSQVTGPQPVSTPSVAGAIAVFFGTNDTVTTGLRNNDRFAVGVAVPGSQACAAGSSVRTSDTPMSGVDFSDKAYAVVNNDSESVTARIASVAFSGAQITPTWDVNDSQATQILLLVLGTGGGGTCAGPATAPPVAATALVCVPHVLCPEEEEP